MTINFTIVDLIIFFFLGFAFGWAALALVELNRIRKEINRRKSQKEGQK